MTIFGILPLTALFLLSGLLYVFQNLKITKYFKKHYSKEPYESRTTIAYIAPGAINNIWPLSNFIGKWAREYGELSADKYLLRQIALAKRISYLFCSVTIALVMVIILSSLRK